MKKILFILSLLSFTRIIAQQEVMTLEKAIEVALKNNYSILISKNESEIAKNDFSAGNAGFLPQVNLNASTNLANNTTKQDYASGLQVNQSGVISNTLNSNVAMNWTLFDGMKMFVTYDKLRELSAMGELNLKIQIEKTVSDIIASYYNIVKQKQLLKATMEALTIYEERIKIAETRFNIGSSSKQEFLQAKVDMNAQRSFLIKQKTLLYESKINLSQLLAKPMDTDFDVNDTVPFQYKPIFDQLKTSTLKQNNSLLFAQKNISVSEYSLKEIRAQRYPKIVFNPSYVFSKSENQAGFVLLNQNLGLNIGFTASLPLFSGFNINRQVKNAKLDVLSSTYSFNEAKSQVEAQLLKAFQNYADNMQVLLLEEENVKLAKENITISVERFRLGASNSLELKEAQRSYEDAQSRLVTTRYNAKLSETELMRLNGELVK